MWDTEARDWANADDGIPPEPEAWTRWDVIDFGDVVEVHFQTNDDGDTGYPGTFAQDTFLYRGPNALQNALAHTGKSRQGVGQRVYVTLDGKEVK